MLKKTALAFIFQFIVFYSPAQDHYTISGCILNMPYSKVYLTSLNGDQVRDIDSAKVDNGCFAFQLPALQAPGLYSLVLSKKNNAFIRLIFNNENIGFIANLEQLLSSINFSSSLENQLFYGYSKSMNRLSKKIEALTKAKAAYQPGEAFGAVLAAEIDSMNGQMLHEADRIISAHPTTLYAKMLSAQKTIKEHAGLTDNEKSDYLRQHYLDFIDFSCEALIHTDLLPNILRNYLSLYENKSLSYDDQEKNYESAVRYLFSKKGMAPAMSNFITRELLNYFQFGNYDVVGAYVNELYIRNNLCTGDNQLADMTTRMEKVRKVAVGKQAPDFDLGRPSQPGRLNDIRTDYTLLVFWSTTCPHCVKMIPDLKKIYDSRKGSSLEVVAISLDTSKTALDNYLRTGPYTWINYADYKGWKGEVPAAYNISGTPTFFILDRDKKIIAKPFDLDELKDKLRSLGL
jgi:thiol-disulfide isomerase/thioredoxin